MSVISREVLAEATRWLVELETTDQFDEIWDGFDAWYQESLTHRAAFDKVRRHRLKSNTSSGLPAYEPCRTLHWDASYHRAYVVAWISDWWLSLAALIALLVTVAGIYEVGLPAATPLMSLFSS